jgi:UDP-glucuronate 4-epimerase
MIEMQQKPMQTPEKQFIVTGGAGFIGSHLVERLLAEGHHVAVLDSFNDFYDADIKHSNLLEAVHHPHCQLFTTDITDATTLNDIFSAFNPNKTGRPLVVVHMAARAGVRPSILQPALYQQANVLGTFNVAEACVAHGASRLVFASSSSVYGERRTHSDQPLTAFSETDDVSRPVSPYAATKAMNESMLHTYSFLHQLPVVALRFFTVYGPRQRPDLAIHKFTRLMDAGERITVFGDGTARRDFTFIDDIIQGVMAALQFDAFTTDTPFEIFNLGESHTTDVNELIRLIEAALGKQALIHFEPNHPADVSITYANVEKARRLLGYKPTIKPEQGIPRFVAWYEGTKTLPAAKASESASKNVSVGR